MILNVTCEPVRIIHGNDATKHDELYVIMISLNNDRSGSYCPREVGASECPSYIDITCGFELDKRLWGE